MMEQVEDTIAEQSTIDERGKGGWWWQSQSHRLMGGTLTTSRGGQEREAVARREAKVDNEASIGGNKDICHTKQQSPAVGASKCGWPFGR